MGGNFQDVDEEACQHYARFMSGLDRHHFDILYWVSFIAVICLLFLASWIFQWTMMCRDKPGYTDAKFRKRLGLAIFLTSIIFFIAAVLCVMEVYAIMALQFCDGEALISLFWSTWTILQLGSEVAILGVVLALWHHMYDMRHPQWALALGTPVLVVAGFGHVLSFAFEHCWNRHKEKKRERSLRSTSRSTESPMMARNKSESSSSANSIRQEKAAPSDKPMRNASILETGQSVYFTLDVGGDTQVQKWPAFRGMNTDGKAILQLTAMPQLSNNDDIDNEKS